MVIYATELVLWLGVFACGGYFNFAPWLKLKIKRRQEQSENAISTEQPNEIWEYRMITSCREWVLQLRSFGLRRRWRARCTPLDALFTLCDERTTIVIPRTRTD